MAYTGTVLLFLVKIVHCMKSASEIGCCYLLRSFLDHSRNRIKMWQDYALFKECLVMLLNIPVLPYTSISFYIVMA